MSARWVAFVLVMLGAPSVALGDCQDTLRAVSGSAITLSLCTVAPAVGSELTIESEGRTLVTTVTSSTHVFGAQVVDVAVPSVVQEDVLLLLAVDKVKVTAGAASFDANVQHSAAERHRHFKYEWSVGPATKGEEGESEGDSGSSAVAVAANESDDTGDSSNSGALRFQYEGNYATSGFFGAKPDSRWQTTASLSIDTTDQSSADFVDNNQVTVGVGLADLSVGRLFMHGTVGLEGNYEKAFHGDASNADARVTLAGWIPPVRSLTLFSKSRFIAAPLKIAASYGYRDHSQDEESANGRVFVGSANYNLFLFDNYQLIFDATWTHNDFDDPLPNVPTTQRLYKATVAYLQPNSTFKVLTSIEDGSAGVMLREVRQYFVGIALSKLTLGGKGGG